MNPVLSQLTPLSVKSESALPVSTGTAAILSEDVTSSAFNDALLGMLNTLITPDAEPDTSLVLAGNDVENPAEAHYLTEETDPQQLLDTLLMASELPLNNTANRNAFLRADDRLITMDFSAEPASSARLSATPSPALPPALTETAVNQLRQMTADNTKPGMTAVVSPALAGAMSPGVMTSEHPQPVMLSTINPDTDDSLWAQQLQGALKARLQVQIDNRVQHATLRLDPPEMGKMDISLQIDNGRLNIHISASNHETLRALQQSCNELRQHLTEQYALQVNINVSSQSGQQQERGQQMYTPIKSPDAGAKIASEDHSSAEGEDDLLLLTV